MIDMQKFSAWIASVQGQYINMDGAYGAQCWDLHAHFADTFGLPRIDTGYAGRWVGWAGNMYDAYPQTLEIEAAYERVPGHLPAEPGDTVIWDDSYWYYPKTHVAIVVKDGPQLLCMSQNSTPSQAGNPYPQWSTGPATIQHLPKGGLLGYLRPRGITVQGSITELQEVQEDDLMATPEQRAALIQELLDTNVDQAGGGTSSLRALISEDRPARESIISVAENVVNKKFTQYGTDGQPSGQTTIANVLGVHDANVVLTRGLLNRDVTVLVDAIISAGIADQVVAKISKKLAE